MNKNILKLLFSAVLVMCCTRLFATTSFWVDEIHYTVTSETDRTVEVTLHSTFSGPAIIPETVTYDNIVYTVTAITSVAFASTEITSVSIPATVTSIGEYAFLNCSSLTSVTINSNALVSANHSPHISGHGGFLDIFGSQVEEYVIGPSVVTVGQWTFYECSGMKTLSFASGSQLKLIKIHAFDGCSGLIAVTIPASVTEIQGFGFGDCTGLTQLTFEGNACQNNIEENAFYLTGSAQTPVALTLPASWDNEFLPEEGKSWYGGYFASNRYFDLDAYKEFVMGQIREKFEELSCYLDSEANYVLSCINGVGSSETKIEVDEHKNDAFNCIALRKRKNESKAEIETARDGVSDWSGIEAEIIQNYLDSIESSSSTDNVNSTRQTALNYMAQHENRKSALAAITDAMGEFAESEYLQSLVADEWSAINQATSEQTINTKRDSAIGKINGVLETYRHAFTEGQYAAFGEMGEPCEDCPAVDVSKGTKNIRLYNPDKVEFLKTTGVE